MFGGSLKVSVAYGVGICITPYLTFRQCVIRDIVENMLVNQRHLIIAPAAERERQLHRGIDGILGIGMCIRCLDTVDLPVQASIILKFAQLPLYRGIHHPCGGVHIIPCTRGLRGDSIGLGIVHPRSVVYSTCIKDMAAERMLIIDTPLKEIRTIVAIRVIISRRGKSLIDGIFIPHPFRRDRKTVAIREYPACVIYGKQIIESLGGGKEIDIRRAMLTAVEVASGESDIPVDTDTVSIRNLIIQPEIIAESMGFGALHYIGILIHTGSFYRL